MCKLRFDTEHGHIVACFILVILSGGFFLLHIPKSEDILMFALGIMGRSMLEKNKDDSENPNAVSTSTHTDTESTPKAPVARWGF